MPYKPMWELLSENADSTKPNCFAEMSSFWWKVTTDTTLSKDSPSLLLLSPSVLGFEDPCLFLRESLEMLSFNQSFTVFWLLGHGISELLWAVLHSLTNNAEQRDARRIGYSLSLLKIGSRAFPVSHPLLSFEARAGKWDFQEEN